LRGAKRRTNPGRQRDVSLDCFGFDKLSLAMTKNKVGREGRVATPQATAVDIGALLDKQKLSAFHLGTFLLCALIIIVDAADTGSANVAAPAILRAFPAERSVMGWVFAWSSIGVF